jgi:hypothetical protein
VLGSEILSRDLLNKVSKRTVIKNVKKGKKIEE